jgi:serine/threonine-protein kinase RsbW
VRRTLIGERSFEAGQGALRDVRSLVDGASRHLGFAEDDCYELTMAVNEAVTNAVEHGATADSHVHVAVAREGGRLTVEVRDRGDFTPRLPVEEGLPPRGRGITLMAQLVDEVCVRASDDGTRVRLSKYLAA